MNAPAALRSREQVFVDMFPGDLMGKLVNGVTNAIFTSFKDAGGNVEKSFDEKRRRFKICMDWAIVLRGDMKWGVERISDAMSEILRTELGGTKWQPTNRQCWIPGDGR